MKAFKNAKSKRHEHCCSFRRFPFVEVFMEDPESSEAMEIYTPNDINLADNAYARAIICNFLTEAFLLQILLKQMAFGREKIDKRD